MSFSWSVFSRSLSARQQYGLGLTLALLGALFFSAKGIVAKLIYQHQVDAITLLALRMLFSLPFFLAIALWQMRTQAPLETADRYRVMMLGLLGYYLSSFLDFLGLQYISVGLERLILFLTPSLVLLISVVFLKQTIRWRALGALVLGYGGMLLVFAHDVKLGGAQVWLGSALVLGAAMAYAAYLLFSAEMVKRIGVLRLVAYAMCVASAACLLQFVVLRPMSKLQQPLAVYGLSFFNGFFCTVLPVLMTMMAVARIGAPITSQAGMIGPVSTLALGAVILHEPITWLQLAGTALVLLGVFLLSRYKSG
jgi:drug/metabolite transporter (DMT)-like permease